MLQIIQNRLNPQAEKIIAEEQAGFRAGRSTTEQMFNLRILCEKYLQHQQDLYHVFIDFKKAFDMFCMQLCGQPWISTTSAQTLSKSSKTSITRLLVPSSSTAAATHTSWHQTSASFVSFKLNAVIYFYWAGRDASLVMFRRCLSVWVAGVVLVQFSDKTVSVHSNARQAHSYYFPGYFNDEQGPLQKESYVMTHAFDSSDLNWLVFAQPDRCRPLSYVAR